MHLVAEKIFPHWSMDREGIIFRNGESGTLKHPEKNCTYFMAPGRDLRYLLSSEASLSSEVYRRGCLILFPWCTHTGLSISPAFCAVSSAHWPGVCYVGLWSRRATAVPVLTGPGSKPQPRLGDLLW